MLAHWPAVIARQALIRSVGKATSIKFPGVLDTQAARLAIMLVKAYQRLLSPWLGQQCLFRPSCSYRAIEHLTQLRWTRGIREIDVQLGRCCGNFIIRVTEDGLLELETDDGRIFPEEELSDFVLAQYRPANCAGTKLFAMLETSERLR
jgi:putative component of membrane protein insertase Oxa1/YidC/SpoIIIJ protein YidD